jgi:hypothetical protein
MKVWGGGGEASAWMAMYDAGQTSFNVFLNVGRLIDPDDGSPVNQMVWDFFSTSSSVAMGSGLWTDNNPSWQGLTQGLGSCGIPDLSVSSFHSGGNVSAVRLYQAIAYRNGETYAFPVVVGRTAELPFTDAASSQFSLNIWGGSHNFLPLPFNAPLSTRLCVPWE